MAFLLMRDQCIICRGGDFLPFLTLSRAESLVKCVNCGVVVRQPGADEEELRRWYETSVLEGAVTASRDHFGRLVRLVQDQSNGNRLLDVGTWFGEFVELAQEAGFSAAAVEPSQSARQYLQNKLRIDTVSSLEEALGAFGPQSFDVVSLWHVLEHLPKPKSAFTIIKQLLSPEGIVALRVPNVNCICFRILGKDWGSVQTTHLAYYEVETLRALLSSTGFVPEILETKANPFANEVLEILKGIAKKFLGTHKAEVRVTLLPTISGLSKSGLSRYQRLTRIADSLTKPLYFLTLPLWRYWERRGLGSEILVVARKTEESQTGRNSRD